MSKRVIPIDDVTGCVINAALRVHRAIGPGLLESAYQAALQHALECDGLAVECEVPLDLHFEGASIPNAYRIDLIVERQVLVEVKSVAALVPLHGKQVLTYLRLSGLAVGLLINFNVPLLKEGVRRIVNGHRSNGVSPLRLNRTAD